MIFTNVHVILQGLVPIIEESTYNADFVQVRMLRFVMCDSMLLCVDDVFRIVEYSISLICACSLPNTRRTTLGGDY